LIKGDIEGASVCYCIDINEWNKANDILNNLFQEVKMMPNKCC
jgi:hypothetical protein